MTAVLPETFDLTDLDFDILQPCEHFEHGRRPEIHEGPGYYYVASQCPVCGRATPIRLFCRKVIETVTEVHCRSCDHTSPKSQFWKVVGTI